MLFPVHWCFGMQWLFRHPEPLHSRQKPVLSLMAEWRYIPGPCTQPQLLECDDNYMQGMMAVISFWFLFRATLFSFDFGKLGQEVVHFSAFLSAQLSPIPIIRLHNKSVKQLWWMAMPMARGSNQDAFIYYCDISGFNHTGSRFDSRDIYF